jgi:hypothetical protein
MKHLIMQFSPTPVTSSLLGPNNLLSTLLSNTLNLSSSFSESDNVPHSYRLNYSFTQFNRQEHTDFELNDSKHSLKITCS